MNKICIEREVIKYESEWKIRQFSVEVEHAKAESKKNIEFILKLSSFTVYIGKNTTWHHEMDLCGTSQRNADSLVVKLCWDNADDEPIRTSLKYSFVNVYGLKVDLKTTDFYEFTQETNTHRFACNLLKLFREAHENIPNNELTIIFQMNIFGDLITTSIERPLVLHPTINNLSNDFAKLLKNNDFSDVTFRIHGKIFHAHRAILAARSPVFSAMFQHPMKERNSNEVPIEDMEPEIFDDMLKYIYTNNVTDIDRTAIDLLSAADKYDLEELKKLCVKSLFKNVTVDNVTEFYRLADRHNVEDLLEYLQRFMATNLPNVIRTPAHDMLKKEYSELLATFYEKLMRK